jgi:hypothetical protein
MRALQRKIDEQLTGIARAFSMRLLLDTCVWGGAVELGPY